MRRAKLSQIIVMSAVAAALSPATASAATVKVAGSDPNSEQLQFVAAPGEHNIVRITSSQLPSGASQLTVSDLGSVLQPGDHCRLDGDVHHAICGDDQVSTSKAAVSLGDGDDELVLGEGVLGSVSGGAGNDRIVGSANHEAEYFIALYGPNSTSGGDQMDGGPGDDVLITGAGADSLTGGDGADELHGGAGPDRLEGGAGNDRIFGDAGGDVLCGGLDGRYGCAPTGTGNDLLDGGADDDRLEAGDGDDRLFGGSGKDSLDGGIGNDHLNGGPGFDSLNGSLGDDLLDMRDHERDGGVFCEQGQDVLLRDLIDTVQPPFDKDGGCEHIYPRLTDAYIRSSQATLQPGGTVSLRVLCSLLAPARCRGGVDLWVFLDPKTHYPPGGITRPVGHGPLSLAPGRSARVRVRLTPWARRQLAHHGRLVVFGDAECIDPGGTSKQNTRWRLTLLAPHRR